MTDLKPVYKTDTLEETELRMDELEAKWDKKYEKVIESWRNNWPKLTSYIQYDATVGRYGTPKINLSGSQQHQSEVDNVIR